MQSINLALILKELRQNAGLTQKQLAAEVGVTKSTISFYELNERFPSAAVLIQLAAFFHVSTDYLLGIDHVKRLDMSTLTECETSAVTLITDLLSHKNPV